MVLERAKADSIGQRSPARCFGQQLDQPARSSQANVALAPLLLTALSGCAVRGAPSFVIAGSYFPGWMFCALIGIVLAIAVRIGFVTSGLASVLPLQLFVCTAIGLCCGLLAWLVWFGQ
jgi:hypothetical protein